MKTDELLVVRERFSDEVRGARTALTNVMARAATMLQEDIQDPALNGEGAHPDEYMLRANQAGFPLFYEGFDEEAASFYGALATLVLEYRARTGARRHIGALFLNEASARAMSGDIDGATVLLLRAGSEHEGAYNTPASESAPLVQQFEGNVKRPALEFALPLAQKVNPAFTVDDLMSTCARMGPRCYALLAYLLLARRHMNYNKEFPNVFSDLQLFSAIRSLSALLEVELKHLSGSMDGEFFSVIKRLFERKPWWTAFEQGRASAGATGRSMSPIDNRLSNAVALEPASDDGVFWRSLLVAFIVRNYAIHQMDVRSVLVSEHLENSIGHIVNVLVTSPLYI